MSSGTCLHADQVGLSVRRKLQQLSAGALPAHNDLAPQIQANQVKKRTYPQYGQKQLFASLNAEGISAV